VYPIFVMRLALRMLVFALVLATTGVFQSYACAGESDRSCAGEAQHDCDDCGTSCGICIACPVTVSPFLPSTRVVSARIVESDVPAEVPARVPTAAAADIFQPPEA
jgi:hypothetical protein